MATGWERWRVQLEEALAPVRAWMMGELAPQPGATASRALRWAGRR
jgi:hypothetical protein